MRKEIKILVLIGAVVVIAAVVGARYYRESLQIVSRVLSHGETDFERLRRQGNADILCQWQTIGAFQ